MSEITIEVEFTDPSGGIFQGTISELMTEVHRRAMIYGTCSYRLISEPRVLYLIEGGK